MKLTERIRERLTCAASAFGHILAHGLELRVPTINPETTAEHRANIMAMLEPGDLVLTSDTSYLLWEGLEYTVAGSHYTHVCMYEGDGAILEATVDANIDGVMRSDLDDALQGPMKIAAVRPPYKTPEDTEIALQFCRERLGAPYDGLFDMDHTEGKKYYCSSLIHDAFQAMNNPIPVERKKALGRWLIIPDAYLHLEGELVVYSDNFTLWDSIKGASPTALGATAATLGFHVMMPHLAPLAGIYLAVGAGNKLQTGNFGLTSGPATAGTRGRVAE